MGANVGNQKGNPAGPGVDTRAGPALRPRGQQPLRTFVGAWSTSWGLRTSWGR